MTPRSTSQVTIILLAIIWAVLSIVSLAIGSTHISLSDIVSQVVSNPFGLNGMNAGDPDGTLATVIWQIRLPRIVIGSLCGAALGAAGAVSQGFFRNPLASPDILGTGAGAACLASAAFFLAPTESLWWAVPLAALLGGACATFAVYRIAGWRKIITTETLLIGGFALTSFFGALTSLVIALSLADYQRSSALMHWLLGGLTAVGWDHALLLVGPWIMGTILALRLAKALDLLALGEDVAASLSINVARLRWQTLLAVALLVGGVVSVAGPLPFVGLIVPYLLRGIIGPYLRPLIVASAFAGAGLVTCADMVARRIRLEGELEVGMVTALIGAPLFLFVILRQSRRDELGGAS